MMQALESGAGRSSLSRMTRLIIIRHGHVEGIDPARFRGRTELALTELGRRQAAAVAARIAATCSPIALYSSPMGRCLETAGAIGAAAGLQPQVLDALNDLDYGDWSWKTYAEARAEAPELFDRWFAQPQLVRFPGGESLQDLVGRTADALRLVIERHPDDLVVMVGHDSTGRASLLQLLDQPLSAYWRLGQSPCAINEIDLGPGRIRVQRINDAAHLD